MTTRLYFETYSIRRRKWETAPDCIDPELKSSAHDTVRNMLDEMTDETRSGIDIGLPDDIAPGTSEDIRRDMSEAGTAAITGWLEYDELVDMGIIPEPDDDAYGFLNTTEPIRAIYVAGPDAA